MPGSTFKVVTATAGAARAAQYTLDSYFPPVDSLPAAADDQARSTTSAARRAAAPSSRSSGAAATPRSPRWASTVGAPRHGRHGRGASASTTRRRSTCPGRPSRSSGPSPTSSNNIPLLAIAGFGQNDVQATPLQMALVAAAVANGGVIMTPHVVDKTVDRRRRHAHRGPRRQPWRTAAGARRPRRRCATLMVEVVNNGTATCCMQLAGGVEAAAKTGTAQLNPEGQPPLSHAWIIAFAPAEQPRVRRRGHREGDAGGDRRAPVAPSPARSPRQVLDAALALPDGA